MPPWPHFPLSREAGIRRNQSTSIQALFTSRAPLSYPIFCVWFCLPASLHTLRLCNLAARRGQPVGFALTLRKGCFCITGSTIWLSYPSPVRWPTPETCLLLPRSIPMQAISPSSHPQSQGSHFFPSPKTSSPSPRAVCIKSWPVMSLPCSPTAASRPSFSPQAL